MSTDVLRLALARLGFTRRGEVFWLTTTPEIGDDELAATRGH